MDPITAELFRNAIAAIGDEMVLTIYRTAYSGVLKNIMDYSAALCDAQGRLVAQGLSLPGHLCSIPVALQAVLARYGDNIFEGDILVSNDPYEGGMHLPDIFLFRPLFADGRVDRLRGHHLPSHRCRRAGTRLQRVRQHRNLRRGAAHPAAEAVRARPAKRDAAPHHREERAGAEPRARRSARRSLRHARSRRAAWPTWWRDTALMAFARLMVETMDYSERLTRHCLTELADGEASFTDWIDDDQIDVGQPIRLVCTVRKQGDRMIFDWTGSAPQVKGAINNTWSYTAAASFTAAKSVLSINMPNNDGVFRADQRYRAARHHHERVAAGRLRRAWADRISRVRLRVRGAGAALPRPRLRGGGRGQYRRHYRRLRPRTAAVHLCRFLLRRRGAGGPGPMGWKATPRMFANMASFSIEVVEAENPLEVLEFELCAGYRRGGEIPRRRFDGADLADAGG